MSVVLVHLYEAIRYGVKAGWKLMTKKYLQLMVKELVSLHFDGKDRKKHSFMTTEN